MFEYISSRLSSIPSPLLIHRVLYSIISKKMEEISEVPSLIETMKNLIVGTHKKMQIDMIWICQLETLENVIRSLEEYKIKTNQLHLKNFVEWVDARRRLTKLIYPIWRISR